MDKNQEKFFKRFGEAVHKIRIEKGLTLEDMQDCGFSPQHFQKIEKGKKAIGFYTVYRISEVFKIKLTDLLRGFSGSL